MAPSYRDMWLASPLPSREEHGASHCILYGRYGHRSGQGHASTVMKSSSTSPTGHPPSPGASATGTAASCSLTGTQRWPTLTLGGAEEQKFQEVLTHPAGGPDVRNCPAPHANSHTNKRAAEGGSKRALRT